MNYFFKQSLFRKSVYSLKRLLNTSSVLNKRPPHHRSVLRKIRKFPFFNIYYDNDNAGPRKVIIDEIKTYPPGIWGSMSIKDAWKRYKESQHLRELPTYFDKLQSMTWTEYNTWYHTLQLPLKFPETLQFAQFLTRTKVIDHIPHSIKDSFNNVSSEEIVQTCKLLKLQLDNLLSQTAPFIARHDVEEKHRQSNEFICQIMDAIVRSRRSKDFFNNYTTSPNCKIETFIKRSGYDRLTAPEIVKDTEGCLRYRIRGNLAWQLRSRDLLKEFVNLNDSTDVNDGISFPLYDYHPKMFDLEPVNCEAFTHLPFIHSIHTSEYARNVPGFWGTSPFKAGDPCGFSVLGVLNTDLSRDLYDLYRSGHQEVIDRHHISEAVLAGFTWTMAQAQNQGFTIYDELTYPLCCCILLTDGCHVQMAYYQLNSISSLWKSEDANFPPNMLWIGPKTKLFDLDSAGQITAIDQHAVHQILSTFTLTKSDLTTAELQPYLKHDAARDVTKLMPYFDPLTATEKEFEEYKKANRHLRVFRYAKSHPNELFYVDTIDSYGTGEMLRKIVPGVDNVPESVHATIADVKLRRRMLKGKKKLLREPNKWE